MNRKRSLAAGIALALSCAAGAAEPTAVAIEYHNTILGHYFITADAAEIRSVDTGGAGQGWVRTGGQFGVFRNAADAPGLSPVCRFYGPGPNSHFYTADAAECELVKRSGGWIYEGVPFHLQAASGGRCGAGTTPVYRTYNDGAARNDSNHRFIVDATVFAKAATFGHSPEGVMMCAPLSTADLQADALRLMRQATFGPLEAETARAAAMGAAAWVDEQLSMPATRYPEYPWMPANRAATCVDDRTLPVTPTSYCARDNYTLFPLQLQFFRNALTQPDQLRGRVAFALSQIMVTSGISNARNYAMRHYQQLLADGALGNFYDLLLAVTLSPVMGDYLDMANNNKANAAAKTEPNENYAREILQLFSVGTYLLNADGTPRLDAAGRRIDTYDQDTIEGFAHVFTGWTYPTVAGATPRANNGRNYEGAMIGVDANHDFGSKRLLGGVTAAAGLPMRQDLEFAHANIFQHPNVGPFIGRQLIQKLVTSDPSPAYVARVSAVFADNGVGQRGDLRAVVRAILLDPEARGARKIDPGYGKLMEPVLFLTGIARAANARSDGAFFRTQSAALAQNVFYPPSVFNFYSPSHAIPGVGLVAPEFQLLTTATAIGRANVANTMIYGTIAADSSIYGATGTQLDLAPYAAVAADAGALADRIDRVLLGGTMTAGMRAALTSAVNAVAATDAAGRARAALYLTVSSPQFQVQR
ncbi:MAG TPA: DUF1800 family protein [Usitatibacter sp.]|nr:DUF1800 family protein [Usitatibacter sp.]